MLVGLGVGVARQVVACQGSGEGLRINEKGHAATGELSSTWQNQWRRATLLRVFPEMRTRPPTC